MVQVKWCLIFGVLILQSKSQLENKLRVGWFSLVLVLDLKVSHGIPSLRSVIRVFYYCYGKKVQFQ